MNQKFFKIKYTSKSNTINNMKWIILAKIRVIHNVPPAHMQQVFVFGVF